jgi:hypothetical protein
MSPDEFSGLAAGEPVFGDDPEPEPEDAPAAKKPRQRFYTSAETAAIAPPVWVVKGLIPVDADVAIYGVSGALKSFVAYDLVSSLAHALPAFGMLDTRTEPGGSPCFYFAGEGFHSLVKKRQLAWQTHRRAADYGSENIFFVDGVPSINKPDELAADIAEMKRLLDGRPLGMFVIDTLARSLGGADEDKSSTATLYFDMLGAIRAHCGGGISLTVGHFGKDTDRGERGSSNFRASYDVVIWVEKHHKDEGSGTHTIQLYVAKLKDGEDGRRYWLQSKIIEVPHEDGEDEDDVKTSLVLIPIEEAEGREVLQTDAQKKKKADRQTLKEEVESALEAMLPGGGHTSTANLLKFLVEREIGSGPHVSNAEIEKTRMRWEKRLQRESKEGKPLYEFRFREGRWALPMENTLAQQMADTLSIVKH